jgi:hypothetical protein
MPVHCASAVASASSSSLAGISGSSRHPLSLVIPEAAVEAAARRTTGFAVRSKCREGCEKGPTDRSASTGARRASATTAARANASTGSGRATAGTAARPAASTGAGRADARTATRANASTGPGRATARAAERPAESTGARGTGAATRGSRLLVLPPRPRTQASLPHSAGGTPTSDSKPGTRRLSLSFCGTA